MELQFRNFSQLNCNNRNKKDNLFFIKVYYVSFSTHICELLVYDSTCSDRWQFLNLFELRRHCRVLGELIGKTVLANVHDAIVVRERLTDSERLIND